MKDIAERDVRRWKDRRRKQGWEENNGELSMKIEHGGRIEASWSEADTLTIRQEISYRNNISDFNIIDLDLNEMMEIMSHYPPELLRAIANEVESNTYKTKYVGIQ